MTISQQLYDQLNQLDLKKTRRSKIDHLRQRSIISEAVVKLLSDSELAQKRKKH